ncbi:MAG TPA: flagellar motor protein [Candidatus Sumerlaeota bacterium]|nr:MAG: Chemotaxis protein PomA [candidate division BRC1 bacterium ADurb.BinA292]HOE96137.1 flagellar motor protein [Candidatus Sumerlaeota bacterium]HOR29017.1 flagellar motor protein [Candidatus Sumerlaeota bacterium]HPK03255.1 flagellar motor protein [Candidatus Sumerlaeota bacterium]
MDIGSIAGLILSFGLILLGNKLEGGHVNSLIQATAALIVLGGTAGACILQFPMKVTINSLKGLIGVFLPRKSDPQSTIALIVDFAKRARREGILALEKEIPNLTDPFFAKALRMAVDGLEPKQLVETMETELASFEEEQEGPIKFFEAAGGYAPTVGILGAVLGLIHVMQNLEDPSKLGGGIATAFVATIYGVGAANLIFLPFSNKLKFNSKELVKSREIILKGVLLIQEGINHSIIEEQLKSYLDEKKRARYESEQGGRAKSD